MLKYETIYTVNGARRRMMDSRRDRYSWRSDGVTRDQDRLTLFALESAAVDDSRHNLEWLLDLARRHDQQYLVLRDIQIQMVGRETHGVSGLLAPRDWMQGFRKWVDSDEQRVYAEASDRGEVVRFDTWRRCFTTREHQGVYEVATGRRMTSRDEIIRAFWDQGFATWRGRPYSVARLRWSGNRDELTELAELYDRHWPRQRTSEMAKRMCSAFRSINRYAAWPGAW